MKYLGLWSPGLPKSFWKIGTTLRPPTSPPPPSNMLNVRSFRDFIGLLVIKSQFLFQNFPNEVFEISKMLKNSLKVTRKAC